MVDFKSKASEALSARISAAGHWVYLHDNEFVASDPGAVQAIIDGYTLDDAKAEKCRLVLAHAAMLRDKVTALVSAGEMAAWPIKKAEAEQFIQLGEAAQCPMLEKEALRRGITLAQLVAKVNANAARFAAAEADIGGIDGRHRDAINTLPTFEAVAAYDFLTDWPEV